MGKQFLGNGRITVDENGKGSCIIFPQGKSSPFSKEVCDFFKKSGMQDKWDAKDGLKA